MFKLYWLEIKRFLKDYLKFIIIGSLLIGLAFSLSLTVFDTSSTVPPEEEIESDDDIFDNDSRAAYFRFYIRHPDGRVFNNSGTMYDLFTAPMMYEIVEDETGMDLGELKKEIRSGGQFEDYEPAKVTINSNSNIFTAVFETGANDNNFELAEFYHEFLMNENFDPLEGNSIYTIVEPQLVEEIEEPVETQLDPQTFDADLVLYIVLGLLLGVIITVIIGLIKEFFSKKLNYAFTYIPEETNNFIILNPTTNNNKVINFFIGNERKNKVILSEDTTNIEFNGLLGDYLIESSLLHLDTNKEIDEVVVLVSAGQTSRKWFKSQIDLSNLINKPIKTVQINS